MDEWSILNRISVGSPAFSVGDPACVLLSAQNSIKEVIYVKEVIETNPGQTVLYYNYIDTLNWLWMDSELIDCDYADRLITPGEFDHFEFNIAFYDT